MAKVNGKWTEAMLDLWFFTNALLDSTILGIIEKK